MLLSSRIEFSIATPPELPRNNLLDHQFHTKLRSWESICLSNRYNSNNKDRDSRYPRINNRWGISQCILNNKFSILQVDLLMISTNQINSNNTNTLICHNSINSNNPLVSPKSDHQADINQELLLTSDMVNRAKCQSQVQEVSDLSLQISLLFNNLKCLPNHNS